MGNAALTMQRADVVGDSIVRIDTGEAVSFSPNPVELFLQEEPKEIVLMLKNFAEVGFRPPADLEDALMNHEFMIVRKAVVEHNGWAGHGGLRPKLIEKALTDDAFSVREAGVRAAGASLTQVQLDRALGDESGFVREAAMDACLSNSFELTDFQIEKLLLDEDINVVAKVFLLAEDHLTNEQIDRARLAESSTLRFLGYGAGVLSDDDLKRALSDTDSGVRSLVARRSNLSGELLERALTDVDAAVRAEAVGSTSLSFEQLERALADEAASVRFRAVHKGGLNNSQFDRALIDKDINIRLLAISFGGLTETQIDRSLNDDFADVRLAALKQGGLTDEQLSFVLTNVAPKCLAQPGYYPSVSKQIMDEVSRQRELIGVIDLAWEKHGVVVDRKQFNDTFAHRLEDQVCTGKILEVIQEWGVALLSRGCGKAMVIDLSAFEDRLFVKGNMEKIIFKDGRIQQNAREEQGRDVGKAIGGR